MYNYVMYHHPDSEPSMQCLNVIRETGLASKIWIQNVEDLSPADIQYCGLRFVRDPDFHH